MFSVTLQALLKKHEALMSDLDAYGSVIDGLRDQAKECKVSLMCLSYAFTRFCLIYIFRTFMYTYKPLILSRVPAPIFNANCST